MATLQLSVPLRNRRLDQIDVTLPGGFVLELRSGALPANCAAASTGALLATAVLPTDSPSDGFADAVAGVKAKQGTWTLVGLGTGTLGHFRVFELGSPQVCHLQGDITATGGGGAMEVDNTSIALSQVVTVNTFTLTDGNA